MIKFTELKENIEIFFKENRIKYYNLNDEHKNISIQIYMILLKSKRDKTTGKKIPIMVTIFKSHPIIFIESFNIYKCSKSNAGKILKIINSLNQRSLPGKYFLDDNNIVSYRSILDYTTISTFNEIEVKRILDSMLPGYFMFLDEIKRYENGK